MSIQSAKDFIERFFNDDEFTTDFLRRVRDAGADGSEGDNKIALKVAAEMGYEMTAEEYKKAGDEYFGKSGFSSAFKLLKRVIKFGRQLKKEDEAKKKKN